MKYTISPEVLALAPDIVIYLLVAKDLTNGPSDQHDAHLLRQAEQQFRSRHGESDIRQLPAVAAYRGLMEKAGLNPNRYPPSIEAMLRRIVKGSQLPLINQVVDRLNVISLVTQLSMGGHDRRELPGDLAFRLTRPGDRFLAMGSSTWEDVPPGELAWLSGHEVQTRRGLWRQSERGKMALDSSDIFFHVVGFSDLAREMDQAISLIQQLIHELGGSAQLYRLDHTQPVAEWQD